MNWSQIVLIAFLLTDGSFATSEAHAVPFRGNVVDAETGEPLEGAVIVIVWYRPLFVPCMDSCSKFHEAVEAVSKSDGSFAIDLSKPWLAHRKTAQVFKPGYRIAGLWGVSTEETNLPDDPIIKLMKLKSLRDHVNDHMQFSICFSDPKDWNRWCVPPQKLPHYTRVHELQWKIFGDQGR